MNITVAAFDVDETLTVRDCVVPFMRSVVGNRRFLQVALSDFAGSIHSIRNSDRDALKKKFVKAVFEGKDTSVVEALGVLFASKIADGWMRQDVANRMRWHQEQGHLVVLVSASLGPYLHPLGDLLEVDGVICTELEKDHGVYTGNLIGQNCRGPEKVHRVLQWIQECGLTAKDLVYAYGDSRGDTELLENALLPIWVKKIDLEVAPS